MDSKSIYKSQTTPKVSVVVPIYNMGKYLSKCVDSLLGQTYENVEIILIDDGSTDNSFSICQDYAQQYYNIIAIHQANSGVSAARNRGLEVASGNYISFVDPDDFLAQNAYKIIVDLMEKNNSDIVLMKDYWFSGTEPPDSKEEVVLQSYIYEGTERISSILRETCSVCRCVFRQNALNSLKFSVGLRHGEDGLFLAQALVNAHKVLIITKQLYYRRKTPNSTTRAPYSKAYLDVVKTSEAIEKLLLEENITFTQLTNFIFYRQLGGFFTSMQQAYSEYYTDAMLICKKLRQRFNNLIRNSYMSPKHKLIVCLYCISPRLYFAVNRFYRRFKK